MFPAADWSGFVLRGIMDISAHGFFLADRPPWAIRVTSVRMRREDQSSISSHPLADPGGKRDYVIALSQSVQFLCSCHEAVPSSRPAHLAGRRVQGPSRLAALGGQGHRVQKVVAKVWTAESVAIL